MDEENAPDLRGPDRPGAGRLLRTAGKTLMWAMVAVDAIALIAVLAIATACARNPDCIRFG